MILGCKWISTKSKQSPVTTEEIDEKKAETETNAV